MIKLKDIFDPYHSHPIMWTSETAAPVAQAIGAKIVGSVNEKGFSKHDLDLYLEAFGPDTIKKLETMGFEHNGSMVVSPREARKSGKTYAKGWQRAELFIHNDNRRIDLWHPA